VQKKAQPVQVSDTTMLIEKINAGPQKLLSFRAAGNYYKRDQIFSLSFSILVTLYQGEDAARVYDTNVVEDLSSPGLQQLSAFVDHTLPAFRFS
jgi:hypothetical protein